MSDHQNQNLPFIPTLDQFVLQTYKDTGFKPSREDCQIFSFLEMLIDRYGYSSFNSVVFRFLAMIMRLHADSIKKSAK